MTARDGSAIATAAAAWPGGTPPPASPRSLATSRAISPGPTTSSSSWASTRRRSPPQRSPSPHPGDGR
eukprot:8655120-Pyramimonas_sp.AAC.1